MSLLAVLATTPDLVATESGAVQVLGVTLVGVSVTTAVKLLFSGLLVVAVLLLRAGVMLALRRVLGGEVADPRRFWARQGVAVVTAVVLVLGAVSIWVTPETDVSTGIGLISAGLAFALQQVIVSLAAYVVILRGDTFGVGDRIELGGVRGDVVRLGFLRTTIMEMGRPPAVAGSDGASWVHARQYTGRLVTVSNGVIFQEPVSNYTRDFPYLWEEVVLAVPYTADRGRAEEILLAAAHDHAVVGDQEAEWALARMRARYAMADASLDPAVYWRITESWLELSVRFLVPHRGVREVKDAMARQVLAGFDAAGIAVGAPTSVDVVGVPPLRRAEPAPEG
ncbi:mechanosensitive ion channel family protein [uncultured Pseudokineococcus sp.]|uniref:mechanosensitive ion channel family protein n=1 Tax=uncultured Pseudokineococcus sp. TaxID=1642928 RepID=UPI00262E591F|nr:mechanosensitive ion channel domain-containing protein [uncultured Pseudokineococcus sp.]